MAFLPMSQQELDAQKAKDQAGGSQTQEQTLSSGSGFAAGTGAGGQAAGKSAPATGGFTNLQDYLGANEGENAVNTAAAAGNNVRESVDKFKSSAADAITDVSGRASGATIRDDADAREKTKGDIAGAINNNASRTKIDYSRSTYSGPSEDSAADDYTSAVTGDYNKATAKVEALKSFGGRGEILKEVYSKPNRSYDKGERRLDNFILGSSAAGKNMLDDQALANANLSVTRDEGLADSVSAVKRAIDTSQATNNSWNSMLGTGADASKAAHKTATEGATAANAKAAADFTKLESDLSTTPGQISFLANQILSTLPDTMDAPQQAFGQAQAMVEKGFDFSQILSNATPKLASASTLMTAPESANYAALQSYLGGEGWDAGFNPDAEKGIQSYTPDAAAIRGLADAETARYSEESRIENQARRAQWAAERAEERRRAAELRKIFDDAVKGIFPEPSKTNNILMSQEDAEAARERYAYRPPPPPPPESNVDLTVGGYNPYNPILP